MFDAWYQEAEDCDLIKYAAAACLSTVDLEGMPDGRIVLLELHDARGFVFFTDERSVKGQELARLPAAALTFYWGPLDRQIRIRGRVELASNEIADACFEQRPRASRLTAWASRQSETLPQPAELDTSYASFADDFED
ncbi:MAG: pyridoxal 5'-phosphate synthase, partial [Acidobacteriota bacterium]